MPDQRGVVGNLDVAPFAPSGGSNFASIGGTVTVSGGASETTLAAILANQTDGDQIVKGNKTPADTFTNPTDSINANSLLSAWDSGASKWNRLLGEPTYGLDVDVTRLPIDKVTQNSINSGSVVPGNRATFNVHLDVQNASGTVGYMLIDLSDTTNWKHTATGYIVLEKLIVHVNSSTSFLGDIELGFLSSVDTDNGDFNKIIVIHGDRSAPVVTETYDFSGFGLNLQAANWFGPVTADDTTWQTDTNLYGPSGATSFPSGNGDFVMKLISTAGNIDIGVTILYTTKFS